MNVFDILGSIDMATGGCVTTVVLGWLRLFSRSRLAPCRIAVPLRAFEVTSMAAPTWSELITPKPSRPTPPMGTTIWP